MKSNYIYPKETTLLLKELNDKKQMSVQEIIDSGFLSKNRNKACEQLKVIVENGLIKEVNRATLKRGQKLLHEITPKGKQWLIKKRSEKVVQCLQDLKDLAFSIDPEKAIQQEEKEQNRIWDQLEKGDFKGKPFSLVIQRFRQNAATTRKRWPLEEILTSLHELYIAIEKGCMNPDSFFTVIKGDHSWIIPTKLLKGLNYPFLLAPINIEDHFLKEIQKRNAQLSHKVLQVFGLVSR